MNKIAPQTTPADFWPELISEETRALLDPSSPADPIARQYVPSADELISSPGERADPIGDAAHSPMRGLVHRHPDRVLLMPTEVCAVHCRFCFRRHALGQPRSLNEPELDSALGYIRAHPPIREVILTGGDPLVLSAERLARLTAALDAIPHLATIRVHSRVPIAAPSRVTTALVAALATQKAMYLAVHCNHARELTREALAATRMFLDAGIPVLAQTVLLRGVNDTADALAELMEALVAARIKPYYLHHCDMVAGAAHFRTTVGEGRALMAELRRRVSGLALPTYVLDIPGGHGKVPVEPGHGPDGEGWVKDTSGGAHRYPPE
ncbi:MAG: lysine-2,3-aminomutase-like protein [Rhodospirillales bacterium]|nr:lysine-2,3-aminomutase-like protein [Rhodospirillales bacterium]MSP79491.1 lysine-2,3-aminomutase-like protein [Rhodospirillales bacterium]